MVVSVISPADRLTSIYVMSPDESSCGTRVDLYIGNLCQGKIVSLRDWVDPEMDIHMSVPNIAVYRAETASSCPQRRLPIYQSSLLWHPGKRRSPSRGNFFHMPSHVAPDYPSYVKDDTHSPAIWLITLITSAMHSHHCYSCSFTIFDILGHYIWFVHPCRSSYALKRSYSLLHFQYQTNFLSQSENNN